MTTNGYSSSQSDEMLWDWIALTVTRLVNTLNATEHFKGENSMV